MAVLLKHNDFYVAIRRNDYLLTLSLFPGELINCSLPLKKLQVLEECENIFFLYCIKIQVVQKKKLCLTETPFTRK